MTQAAIYKGPLESLSVIDFGWYYAGPMAAMYLADQGANVIRVVKPGDRELSPQQFRLLNRNKRLIELDLKSSEGKTLALSLIEKADVLIENFRPGVMERLGLDYASVKRLNPSLIYLSIPGFASTDKERCHIQAWEGVVAAAGGLYTDLSLIRQQFKFPPVYTSIPHFSVYAAVHGAVAVMAALLAREKHGHGTFIEAPMFDAGLSAFSISFVLTGSEELRQRSGYNFTEIPKGLEKYAFSEGDSAEIQLEKLNWIREAFFAPLDNFYECADGKVIYICATSRPIFADRIVRALGLRKELLQEGYVIVNGAWEQDLANNLAWAGALPPERKHELEQKIKQRFRTKARDEWAEIFMRERAPFAAVRTREDWLSLQPMLESGILIHMDDGQTSLTVPGPAADVSGPNGTLFREFHEPTLVTYEEAIDFFDGRVRYEQLEPAEDQLKGNLLKNVKVLDLSNVVAGPISSYTLAQYGAEVVKLDFPDHQLPFLMAAMLEINQGKRSILADLRTTPGQDVLSDLVKWADLVIHNVLDDSAVRMGITHDRLKQINPDIITCQLSCFGGTSRGVWENRPGYDPVAQCESGLMSCYGTAQSPHWHGGTAAADTFGGLNLAYTCLLALYQKHRTGHTAEGRTSLARAANFYQLPYMISENGHSDWGEPQGQCAMGKSPWQRLYRCRDKWIYVESREASKQLLGQLVIGQPDYHETDLEVGFVDKNCAEWVEFLTKSGIACHAVQSFADIITQESLKVSSEPADVDAKGALDILRYLDHPWGCALTHLAPTWVRIGEKHSYKRLGTAPRFGEHTEAILKDIGYDPSEIAALIKLKVVYNFLPALSGEDKYFFEPENKR